MKQAVFDTLTTLEMRDEKEKLQSAPYDQRIQILDPDAAKFLYITALGAKAKNIIEIGAGHGYATLWLALAAEKNGGKVTTCEIDPARAGEAKSNFDKAGLSDYIELTVGDAREILRSQSSPADLVFIDAEMLNYEAYFDAVYKRMSAGSITIANKAISNEDALEDYISYVQNHPNLESVTAPIGDGLEVTVKTTD